MKNRCIVETPIAPPSRYGVQQPPRRAISQEFAGILAASTYAAWKTHLQNSLGSLIRRTSASGHFSKYNRSSIYGRADRARPVSPPGQIFCLGGWVMQRPFQGSFPEASEHQTAIHDAICRYAGPRTLRSRPYEPRIPHQSL